MTKIFISYSHKDEELCLEFMKHLAPMRRENIIDDWFDRKINPSVDWDSEIKNNLIGSDIVLFMISPDFLSSDYIHENEIPIAMELHQKKELLVIPIMLRNCDLEFTPFNKIQGLPKDLKPVTSSEWFNVDDAFTETISGVKLMVKKINEKKLKHLPKKSVEKDTSKETGVFYENSSNLTIGDRLKALFFPKREDNELAILELNTVQRGMNNIANEIHDDYGYNIRLMLDLVDSLDGSNPKVKKLKDLLENHSFKLRNLSHELIRTNLNHYFDLFGNLCEMRDNINQNGKIKLSIEAEGEFNSIGPKLEINIYRIIQELVHNILNHSNADNAYIVIKTNDKNLSLEIKDDGIGFTMGSEDIGQSGIGLRNVKKRVEYFRGTLSIKASKRIGTIIQIQIPITAPNHVYN